LNNGFQKTIRWGICDKANRIRIVQRDDPLPFKQETRRFINSAYRVPIEAVTVWQDQHGSRIICVRSQRRKYFQMRITAQLLFLVVLIASSGPALAQLEATEPAPSVFLVAKPEMPDPNFAHAVILILSHDDNGTSGLMLTQPSGLALTDEGDPPHLVYSGGPVSPNQVEVLVRGERPDSSFQRIWNDVWWGTDREVIQGLLEDNFDPDVLRVFVGYAGWVPGQLEAELGTGDAWALFQGEPDDVFLLDPDELWDRFMDRGRLFASRTSQ
jgi:putative transcriptional regulator